nr:MFS transporter [Chloroflexota bacterium]
VLSWLATGKVIGTVCGLIIGGVVAGLYVGSWRLAFLFVGIPGLLLVLAVWRLPEPARHPASEKRASASILDVRQVLAHFWTLLGIKTLVVLLLMGILEAFALSSLTAYVSPLLQQRDAFGLSSGQAGLFAGLGLALAGIPGVLLGGYLADWLNRRYPGARMLVCGLSLALAAPLSLAMILTATTHNIGLFTALFLGTLFADSAHAGSLAAARLDVVPALMRGSAVAIAICLNRILGSGLAPTVVGLLARSFDPGGQHFLHALAGHDLVLALAVTCPVAFLAAGVLSLLGLRWVQRDRLRAERGANA